MDALYNVGAKFLEPIEQLGPQDGRHRSPPLRGLTKGDSLVFLELSLDFLENVCFFLVVVFCVCFNSEIPKYKLEHLPAPLLKPF